MNDPQPLINAIVNQLGDADHSRSQRFLDDLRQEGVLPGRRSRLAHRLRRARRTLAACMQPVIEFGQDMFRRRRPASYWVEEMDRLIAEGRPTEDAAREVARAMEREDRALSWRWGYWLMALGLVLAWVLFVVVLVRGV